MRRFVVGAARSQMTFRPECLAEGALPPQTRLRPDLGPVEANVVRSRDDDHRAPANYGANYKRLSAVKAALRPGQPLSRQPKHRSSEREVSVVIGLSRQGTREMHWATPR